MPNPSQPTGEPMTPERTAEYFYEKWEKERDNVSVVRNDLTAAYRERAQLVALLAAIYPSTWGIDPDWTDWHVVYVQLPTGQASWHISPKDRDLFPHVSGPAGDWDGHTTDEKYQRIRQLVADLTPENGTGR
jgi:hypothetical protein